MDNLVTEHSDGWIYNQAAPGIERPMRALLAKSLERCRCSLWINGHGISFYHALELDGGYFINTVLTSSEEAMRLFCLANFTWWAFALAWLGRLDLETRRDDGTGL